MCDKCYIDEVSIYDIPTCFMQSFLDIFHDLTDGSLTFKSFTTNDRIFYVILLIIFILVIRLILKRNENKEPYEAIWKMDARWNS